MFDFSLARQTEEKLISEINALSPGLLENMPVEAYMAAMKQSPEMGSYYWFGDEVGRFSSRLIDGYGQTGLEMYHKLLLVRFIMDAETSLPVLKMPPDINALFHQNFGRIIRRVESKRVGTGFFLLDNDLFCKDLSLCRLSLIPAGYQKIHMDGIARRYVFKSGIIQAMKLLSFACFETGGFSPFFQMHTDKSDRDLLAEFNLEGAIKFYFRVSELLRLNSKIKGVFGISWLNDPQLAIISPELWAGTGYAVENGAKLFKMGSNSSAISGATAVSKKRKQLYEEGSYLPTNYLMAWSRKRILAWADDMKAERPS